MRLVLLVELVLLVVADKPAQAPPVRPDQPSQLWITPAPRPVFPTDPLQPAPAGWEWKRYPGQPWQLYRVEEPQRPFVVVSTPGTTVRVVGQPSIESRGSTRTGLIRMFAPAAGTPGGTNCPPAG